MDISFFKTLDVAQDKTTFINLIKGANGKVLGRACMSEADCSKISVGKNLHFGLLIQDNNS